MKRFCTVVILVLVGCLHALAYFPKGTIATTNPLGSGLNFQTLSSRLVLPQPATYTRPTSTSYILNTTQFHIVTQLFILTNGLPVSPFTGNISTASFFPNAYAQMAPGQGSLCGQTQFACVAFSPYDNGANHLWTVTDDGTNLRLYVDAVLVATVATMPGTSQNSSWPMRVGSNMFGTPSTMIELRVYGDRTGCSGNSVLTQTEISALWALYQANQIPPGGDPLNCGFTQYYPFSASTIHVSGGVGTVDDTSGNGYTGYISTTPPSVAVTVPTTGATLTNLATLTATASAIEGISQVQFKVDGNNVCSVIVTPPFTCSWNSASVIDGAHTITAVATTWANNTATSAGVSVTTSNGTAPQQFYFATAGSDIDPCTISQPCQTIPKANSITLIQGSGLLFNGGDTFTGCLSMSATNVPAGSQASPIIVGAYGTGTPTFITNCTGETGGVQVNGMDGLIVQDMTIQATSLPTPRAAIMVQNNTGSRHGGYIFQRVNLSGIQYFRSTASPGGQGTNGANLFWEGFPGTGGLENISILNSTIGGTSGNTSPDDGAIAGFGNGINLFTITIRGNIAANIGGGPVPAAGYGKAYPPMGDGIHIQAMNGVTSEFNLAHDNGGNMSNCGGPSGVLTAASRNGTVQFHESYNITYVPAGAANYPAGWCDGEGGDFDNDTQDFLGQYVYSHDNAGPSFLLFMNNTGSGWDRNYWRYSIGENDDRTGSTGLAQLTFQPLQNGHTGGMYNMTEWNNLSFNGSPFGNTNVCAPGFAINTASTLIAILKNSIFSLGACTAGGGGWEPANLRGVATPTGLVISNNVYHNRTGASGSGSWWYGPTLHTSFAAWQGAVAGGDPGSTVSDPLISGTPPFGVCTWTPSAAVGPQPCPGGVGTPTYGVSAGSPAISGGTSITSTPVTPTRDYYANTVPGSGTCWNIGAYGVCP